MKLIILRGADKGREYLIEEGNNLIGRWDPDSASFPEVDLEDQDIDAKVSRKHAVIERKGTLATLEDLGSRNGTFVNRATKLEPGQIYELKDGDEIIIGKTFLRFSTE